MAPETVLGENIIDFRPSRHRAPLSATPPERASHSPSTVPRRATKKLSHRSYWGFLMPPRGYVTSPRGYVDFPPGGRVVVVPPGGLGLCLPSFGRPPGGTIPPGVPRQQVPRGGRRRQKSEKGVSEWKPAVSKSGEGSFQNGNRPFPEWKQTHYLCKSLSL